MFSDGEIYCQHVLDSEMYRLSVFAGDEIYCHPVSGGEMYRLSAVYLSVVVMQTTDVTSCPPVPT